eukprot:CAMPEP_0169468360 /NCGR_PEP_ID=MMETSP1042-20121227/22862_1 /TAXON_ID=464988 /ORGANISM="Hemiselmis andersenii, Strain CCMP1180" /LENGTH=131 /DNA_ID=CAMNT_0009581679 /DNA_START=741 /DNA_END=1133 /DNA_ORIENTATION=-
MFEPSMSNASTRNCMSLSLQPMPNFENPFAISALVSSPFFCSLKSRKYLRTPPTAPLMRCLQFARLSSPARTSNSSNAAPDLFDAWDRALAAGDGRFQTSTGGGLVAIGSTDFDLRDGCLSAAFSGVFERT